MARLAGWLAAGPAVPLTAQVPVRAAGRVVRTAGTDSIPVPGARVLLHHVGRAAQGPIDSTITGRQGGFAFRFLPDTAAAYLTSSRYDGIEYFSPAVHLDPARPDTGLRIVVSDTSSRAPVELAARHLVIADPGEDGTRGVLDLIVLQNRGDRTRVAPDTAGPAWGAPLPAGTFGLEPGQGDVSPEALRRVDDRLLLFAPIAPGEKQLIVQYGVPAGVHTLTLPFPEGAGFVNVLVASRDARVTGGALAPADTEVIQGRTYRRWMGPVAAGAAVTVTLAGSQPPREWALPLLVGALIVGLAAGAVRWLRAPGVRPAPAAPEPDADVLLERLAQLDARYLGRQDRTDPGEWRQYQSDRARLKTALETAMAARRGGR